MGLVGSPALSEAPHSPQKRAPGALSKPHLEQCTLNGAPHWLQNFNPSGLSLAQLEQRIDVFGRPMQLTLSWHSMPQSE